MSLNNFAVKEARPLPIFVLADASGSMKGAKINELNIALRGMINSLNDAEDIRGKFQLSIITFGGDGVNIIQPLADIDKLSLNEIRADGCTPMGKAFRVVKELIEDRNVVTSRAFSPTVILISDGLPTDCPDELLINKKYLEWKPMSEFHDGNRSSKSQRLALGIGADADLDMLKAYINNPCIPVIKTNDALGIAKFFKWATMSVVARMNSINPNETAFVAPLFDMDDEDISI